MPRASDATDFVPPAVARALQSLGEGLALARKRRKESQAAWAARIGVSRPTLIRMERGDPTVGIAVYASALWLMGRHQALAELSAPEHDLAALQIDVQAARARGRRSPPSAS